MVITESEHPRSVITGHSAHIANSERLAVVLAWWAIICISAHSAFAAGSEFRTRVRVGQRRLLVGACTGPRVWLGLAAMG